MHPSERGALVPDEDKGVYSVDTPFASSRKMGIRQEEDKLNDKTASSCILARDGHKEDKLNSKTLSSLSFASSRERGIGSKVEISDHSLLLKGNDVVIQLFSVGNHDGILTAYRYVCG